jgi:hypothetical protein
MLLFFIFKTSNGCGEMMMWGVRWSARKAVDCSNLLWQTARFIGDFIRDNVVCYSDIFWHHSRSILFFPSILISKIILAVFQLKNAVSGKWKKTSTCVRMQCWSNRSGSCYKYFLWADIKIEVISKNIMSNRYNIVTCTPLIWRVLVRMIGFINRWLRTRS